MRRSGSMEQFNVNGGLQNSTFLRLIPDAFYSQNMLTIARVVQSYNLPMVDSAKQLVSPAKTHQLNAEAMQDINHKWGPYKIFAHRLMPAFETTVKKFAHGQSSVSLARTAIALERFRLAQGNYPDSLDALAPQYIATVPHDLIGGGPLKYRRTADGDFILYSIGWNETDNDGKIVFSKGTSPGVDIAKGDWVWRYPAKN
jgi:hypothetical protein